MAPPPCLHPPSLTSVASSIPIPPAHARPRTHILQHSMLAPRPYPRENTHRSRCRPPCRKSVRYRYTREPKAPRQYKLCLHTSTINMARSVSSALHTSRDVTEVVSHLGNESQHLDTKATVTLHAQPPVRVCAGRVNSCIYLPPA
ncbi:hypothetical protein CC85DRAFT_140777 [Cutaneotrichosporon oleaginosum]|uniref:Uncharacterized protein n=1 Tax=Cutaneotrichosporon oleaginosum TaxID=879819 RepID=A0A0J0XI74_9TREE|nr:uncharacterized protein CC85DRAFT_140777 [Cutaneotrichosporon oleaginosum]KLT40801.1 hypothetical protein CC85DRAFT_140777 [Cutaneotrichosporon oleaginosum]TXT11887.1 hypothetical protein COLE_02297 [Cutaneotrichosporon oleaginosum]